MGESQSQELPACRTSLLQVHLFHLSGNHWAEDWWAQWTQLIITSLPSLPVGRGWALLQPFDLSGNTSAWVQDRAPPDWESWADVDQAESLAASPHLCLLLGPPALSSETSRHQPGQSSWELDMFLVWLRWMAIPMGKMGTWGRQRGDRLCCGLSSGPVVQLERACRLPRLAPVQRERQPLSLVSSHTSTASPGPPSPKIQLHFLSHSSSLCMQKQTASDCHGKNPNFSNEREVEVLRLQETHLVSCQMSSFQLWVQG